MIFTTPDPEGLGSDPGPAVRCAACKDLTRSPLRVRTGSPDCHADCPCGGAAELAFEPACSQGCAYVVSSRSIPVEHLRHVHDG